MARTFGASDDLRVSNPIIGATGLFPFTMACWVRLTTLSDTNVLAIGNLAGAAGNWHTLDLAGTANQVEFDMQGASGATSAIATKSVTLIAGQWYHVAGVRSSASNAICYVNGSAGTAATGAQSAPTGMDTCIIGGGVPSGGGALTGHGPAGVSICQVGIWNSALSGSDIASLATMGTEVDSVQSGSLVGCWKLKNGVIQPVGGLGQMNQANGPDGTTVGTIEYELLGTATQTVTVSSLLIGIDATSNGAHGIFGLYTDNGSGTDPNTLLATTASTALPSGVRSLIQIPLTTTASIVSGNKYWIGMLQPSGDTGTLKWSVGPGSTTWDTSTATTATTLPTPADVGGPGGTFNMIAAQAFPGEPDVGSGNHPMVINGTQPTLDPWWDPDGVLIDQQTIGKNSAAVSSSTIAFTTTALVAPGGFIVLQVGAFSSGGATLTGVAGGGLTWTIDRQANVSSVFAAIVSAQAPAGLAVGTTITATFTGTFSTSKGISGASWTGVANPTAINVQNGANQGTGTAWNSGSLVTTYSNVLIVGCVTGDGSGTNSETPAAGFIENNDHVIAASGDAFAQISQIASSAGTYTPGGTWASTYNTYTSVGVAYSAAAGVSAHVGERPNVPTRRHLLPAH